MHNPDIEVNLKHLEEKIEQAINLVNNLRQENLNLKEQLKEMQQLNNRAVEKINFVLDNISKLL